MRKQLVAVGLILAWGALVASTFWRMELRFLRPAERPQGARAIDPTTRPNTPLAVLHTDRGAIPLRGALTLLNFWSPDCACSRFMERHVRELVETYRPHGVRFITVIIADRKNPSTLLRLWRRTGIDTPAVPDPDGAIARQMGVWAGPAAVILDKEGRIAYIGAYNIGRYCDNKRTAYAQQALEALLVGKTPPRQKVPFYGCQVPDGE